MPRDEQRLQGTLWAAVAVFFGAWYLTPFSDFVVDQYMAAAVPKIQDVELGLAALRDDDTYGASRKIDCEQSGTVCCVQRRDDSHYFVSPQDDIESWQTNTALRKSGKSW